jgi:hypothetical protein
MRAAMPSGCSATRNTLIGAPSSDPATPVSQQLKSAVGCDQLTEAVDDDGRIRQVAVKDMLKRRPNWSQQWGIRR